MRAILMFLTGASAFFAQMFAQLLAQPPGWVAMGTGGTVQATDDGAIFSYDLQPEKSTGAHTIEIAGLEILTGGVKLQLAPGDNPLGVPAMQAASGLSDGRFGLVVRGVSTFDLAKAARLTFDVAWENQTTLVISLEMKNGRRFTQAVFPPGKREVFHASLKLADLEGEGRFDPALWKSIAIADTLGQPNTMWVAKVAVE